MTGFTSVLPLRVNRAAQLGSPGYFDLARRECRLYIELLRRSLGAEPEGAHLAVKSNPHDFGTYLSVVCYFDRENAAAADYAYRCESEGPEEWDTIAREVLSRQKERSQP